MILRPELPTDKPGIRAVQVAAFRDHPYSRNNEHTIVDALRDAGALTVSLVAVEGDALLGHIAFSPIVVAGAPSDWQALGPLAVAPERQRRGIGAALVREGLAALRNMGACGCVVLGAPTYYGRFGFRMCTRLLLEGAPPAYFQCLPFNAEEPDGRVTFHPAFDLA